ncbi:hypothetical protein B0H13DRAFT_2362103 [Mycena leptocephala]|nr:hypothetical protein B0H13DRAFT_2362103 [Mycena leptocephala]
MAVLRPRSSAVRLQIAFWTDVLARLHSPSFQNGRATEVFYDIARPAPPPLLPHPPSISASSPLFVLWSWNVQVHPVGGRVSLKHRSPKPYASRPYVSISEHPRSATSTPAHKDPHALERLPSVTRTAGGRTPHPRAPRGSELPRRLDAVNMSTFYRA